MSEDNKKSMVSYWKNIQEVYTKDGFTIICGDYEGREKTVGVHWPDYPNSRGYLTPCVIPKHISNPMIEGLIVQSINMVDDERLKKLQKAYSYINS